MSRRLELDKRLRAILGSKNTYFHPPESVKLKYPCFVYELDGIDQKMADNRHYIDQDRYSITYITKDVESDIARTMFNAFPTSSFEDKQSSDGMWHYIFSLYF